MWGALAHRAPGTLRAEFGKEAPITNKVFVGNLNFETAASELESLFGEVGSVVEVFMPVDRVSGRPRGIAFVQFEDAPAVAAAIERFNGYQLGGRTLRVNEAEARPARAPRTFQEAPPAEDFFGRGNRVFKAKGSRRNIRRSKRSL